jgi:hypothetical protein
MYFNKASGSFLRALKSFSKPAAVFGTYCNAAAISAAAAFLYAPWTVSASICFALGFLLTTSSSESLLPSSILIFYATPS